MVFYFKDDGNICRFIQKENGTFQITMYELSEDGQSFEVFYLERFREFENAMDALCRKGVEYDQLYTPSSAEIGMMLECCV